MSVSFDAHFATAAQCLADVFGQSDVVVVAAGQTTGTAYTAMVGEERTDEDAREDGRGTRRVRNVAFSYHADLPFWAQPPVLSGTIQLAENAVTVEYAIEAIEILTPQLADVRIVRRGVVETSRPQYRRP